MCFSTTAHHFADGKKCCGIKKHVALQFMPLLELRDHLHSMGMSKREQEKRWRAR